MNCGNQHRWSGIYDHCEDCGIRRVDFISSSQGINSLYAYNCGNCRCQYDLRSFIWCPGCGTKEPAHIRERVQNGLYASQHSMSGVAQGLSTAALRSGVVMQMTNPQYANTLSNVWATNPWGQSVSEAAAVTKAIQNVGEMGCTSGIPELDEYENRVAQIKVELPEIAKETKMFSLLAKRKELQIEIKKLSENLEHEKRQMEMRIAEAVQKHRLQANEELSKLKVEMESKMQKAEATHRLQMTELQGKATRDKAEMQAAHAKELADAKAKMAEDYFEKLSKATQELHQNGDKNSKFIQEMALAMVKKAPRALPGNTSIRVKGSVKDLKELEQG